MHIIKKSLTRAALVAAVLITGLLATSTVTAQQVPQVLPYQGFLARANGTPVEGNVTLTFNLYANNQDVEPQWTETHENVIVQDGVFYVYLGQEVTLLDYFGDGTTKYLGIAVNDDPEAEPRQNIGSVPYALLAGNALALEGFGADYFASQTDIANFLTDADVANFVTQNDINDFVTQTDLENYVTDEVINNNTFVTEADLENYVTQNDINNFVTEADLDNYVTQGDLNNYVTQAELNNYVTQADLNNYVTQNELNQYVTETELENTLNEYVTEADLANYVTQADLANYVTLTQFNAAITNLQDQIDNLQGQINNIEVGGGAITGFVLGQSSATFRGAQTYQGLTGLRAMDEICRDTFNNEPTAHVCHEMEIQRAVASNSLGNGLTSNVEAWIVHASSRGNSADNTSNNTCHGMLYGSGDIGRGSSVRIFRNGNPGGNVNVAGDYYNVQFSKGCNNNLPVMCCR